MDCANDQVFFFMLIIKFTAYLWEQKKNLTYIFCNNFSLAAYYITILIFPLCLSIVGWIVFPTKICESPNSWYLWIWPCLEIGPLQIEPSEEVMLDFSSVQLLSCVQLFATHEPHARPPCPSPTPRVHPNSCSLSWWCHPTISSSVDPFSSCPQSFPASGSFQMSQLFVSGGQSIWSFSFSISPSNEYSGLISFRMDWLDLLAVQGTLKSLLQHHSSKALLLLHSAFFIVQLSHPYMTTGKTKALTRRTFVDKVLSLLFNMLSGWS